MKTYKEFMEHIHSVHQGGKIKMAKPENASAKALNLSISSATTASTANGVSSQGTVEAGSKEQNITGIPIKEMNNAGDNPEGEKTSLRPLKTGAVEINAAKMPPIHSTEIQSCELQTVIIPQFKTKSIQKPVVLEQTSSKDNPGIEEKESSLSQLQTSDIGKVSNNSQVQKTKVSDEQKGVRQMLPRAGKRKLEDDDKENVLADEVAKMDETVVAEKTQLVTNREKV